MCVVFIACFVESLRRHIKKTRNVLIFVHLFNKCNVEVEPQFSVVQWLSVVSIIQFDRIAELSSRLTLLHDDNVGLC
jgi:hypothetical protein